MNPKRLAESNEDRRVPIASIKHLIIRFYELQSSISDWKISLASSTFFSKLERDSIKETIRVENLQLMALKQGLPVIMSGWEQVEITEKDKEDYRLRLFENEKTFQKSNFANNDVASLLRHVEESNTKDSVFIPPKSVFVVPISKPQKQYKNNEPNAQSFHNTSSNIPSFQSHISKVSDTSIAKRRIREKTPEIQQSTGDFPAWNKPLFTRTKNWISHFKYIESLFLEFSSKSDQEKSIYLKNTINTTLHNTLCYHEDDGRLLHVWEMNQRGITLFGPTKDAPHFCDVHGFGMHITGDCNESKKHLCGKCNEIMEEGVEHRCAIAIAEAVSTMSGNLQNTGLSIQSNITYQDSVGQDEEMSGVAAISYCTFCLEKNGVQVESSYDHMFEFHYVKKDEMCEEEDLNNLNEDIRKNPVVEEEVDYGWRRNNYYKGKKNFYGEDKSRDNYGRPIKKKSISRPTSRDRNDSPGRDQRYSSRRYDSPIRDQRYPSYRNDYRRKPYYSPPSNHSAGRSLQERSPKRLQYYHNRKPNHYPK